MQGVQNVSWRNEVVDGKARHVENDVVNAPELFHPGPSVVHGELAASEYGGDGTALMRYHNPINVPVVPDAASYGGLPVDGLILSLCGLNFCQMGVLQVDKHAALLTKIPVQRVPDHFCWAFASFHHSRRIC